MNWRAADKVAAWKVFKRRMEVIFVADQIPEERQWALILVAGGDEAYVVRRYKGAHFSVQLGFSHHMAGK